MNSLPPGQSARGGAYLRGNYFPLNNVVIIRSRSNLGVSWF